MILGDKQDCENRCRVEFYVQRAPDVILSCEITLSHKIMLNSKVSLGCEVILSRRALFRVPMVVSQLILGDCDTPATALATVLLLPKSG